MIEQKPRVLVYRNQLLPISETFVYNQTMRLTRYETFILGAKLAPNPRIEIPPERRYLINSGGWIGFLKEVLFKVIGYISTDVLRWVRKIEPTLLHAHFGPDGIMVISVAKILHIPLVITFHGRDATLKAEFANNYADKKYFRHKKRLKLNAHYYIAVSEFIREKLLEQGFPAEKIVVHYIGIFVKDFIEKQEFSNPPIILFVGRLVPKKGCELVIRAFQTVIEKIPTARLIIIGDGLERMSLEHLVDKLNLQQVCEFLGSQPHQEVKKQMTGAWLLCAPSTTDVSGDSEGLPNVILEAMASGIPVVSTYHAGIPEAVVHGETGLLSAEGDIEGITHNLIQLLENNELCRKMGSAGRERVEKLFDLEIQNAKLETIYDDVIKQWHRKVSPKR